MKKAMYIFTFLIGCNFIVAQTNTNIRYQKGYVKKSSGAYVEPHYKTNINKTNHDNFSTSGNTNNYTEEQGTRAKDYSKEASRYGNGQVIHTGAKGGQYYINSNGKKTYVPKRK